MVYRPMEVYLSDEKFASILDRSFFQQGTVIEL